MSNHPNRAPPARTAIPPTLQAKLAQFQLNRQTPPANGVNNLETQMQGTSLAPLPTPFAKPSPGLAQRINHLKGGSGIASRRPKPSFSLRDIDPNLVQPGPSSSGPAPPTGPGLGLSAAGLGAGRPTALPGAPSNTFSTPFSNFSKIVDPSGALNFNGKAVLHSSGVNFENGASFTINMDQLQLDDEELGKGNYGTVKKVLHKPTNVAMAMKEIRLELDQAKLNAIIMELDVLHRAVAPEIVEFYGAFFIESCVYYCMEYMDAGSLDKLISHAPSTMHVPKPPSPPQSSSTAMDTDPSPEYSFSLPFEEEEVDFANDEQFTPYNAAFNHRNSNCPSHIYNGGPIPETILGRIAGSMVRGLKFLKDELNIMHRDVKPTNVLINRKGEVKLCDFGVSGQLDQSMARTNIGCQSYMAPERIRGESRVVTTVASTETPNTAAAIEANGVPGTANLVDELYGAYTVSSDVWSLGLSIIELGLGRYPYPPETYSNVFAQLTAIVHGPPPCLPSGPPPAVLTNDPSSSDVSEDCQSATRFEQQLEGNPFITTPGKPRPGYSPFARDWVNKCMRKEPGERATYKQLLEHPWLVRNAQEDVDMIGWVKCALEAKERVKGRGR